MIRFIDSSIKTFKRVEFRAGLNILLVDTHPDASQGQTRNSAGKTSLVEIIHFLLGADVERDSIFRLNVLKNEAFFGGLAIDGCDIEVERTGADPSRIFFRNECFDALGVTAKLDKKTGRQFISNTMWKQVLANKIFGIPFDRSGSVYAEPYAPSFRALISYFARRRNSGGFLQPERYATVQQRGDYQVNLSCLLGLDWQIAREFERLRQREKSLSGIRKAAKTGAFGHLVGTVAELRPKLTVTKRKAEALRERLSHFEVHESYRQDAQRAANAKMRMQKLTREIVTLNERLESLNQAIVSEAPPRESDVQRVYEAAGVELPQVALRRYDEVQSFYRSIVQNRRFYLQSELDDVRHALRVKEDELERLAVERRTILQALAGKGALEDFLKMQAELAEAEAQAASLDERFRAAQILEGESTQLRIDRMQLKLRLEQDLRERKDAVDAAILTISDTFARLYDDRYGYFLIEATDNGPEFRIHIEGDRGGGIANMEIFCFDAMLYQVARGRSIGPSFLVHDSHLFDGVDSRQISKALEFGHQMTSPKGQYIVTMNSDVLSGLSFSNDFEIYDYVLPTRLTDKTDSGGLFGFRFS